MEKINWNKTQIWQGCMLSSIAHAISVAQYPEFANEHSWDGDNYSVQDSQGGRGTITFNKHYCVAAFRDENSNRIDEYKDALDYLKEAPWEVQQLAESEALQYLLDEIDGNIAPVITTAFWCIQEEVYSQDPFHVMIEHGGFLLNKETMEIESAIDELQEYHDLSEKQVYLLKSLFTRKISKPLETIVLTEEEVLMIEAEDEEALSESRISFEEIGIKF